MHVCPLQYSPRTLPETQSKTGLLADKLSEVQMSYFYLCLCVCQYLWIIKFMEWAYRKKRGDMRGYFHRLGYWAVKKVFVHCNFLLYISYKTTIFQNIIPKSILVRFWWYFLPTEARTYVVFCDYFKIFFWSTDLRYSWLKLFVFKCTIIVMCFLTFEI